MSYVKLTNGVPEIYSIGKLRRDNPNVSFPKAPSDEVLEKWDVYPLVTEKEPKFDRNTHFSTLEQPALVDGVWKRVWTVSQHPENTAAALIRKKRDAILAENIDVMNPIRWESMTSEEKSAWTTYRQALLDVPAQSGFPFNVVWPTKPE